MLKPVLGSQIQLGHPLARGLVGAWLMNEGSGNKVNDLSGKGNTGTLISDTHFVPGKFGSCLSFDGTDDYVTMPFSMKIGNPFSFAFWIYPLSVADYNQNVQETGMGWGVFRFSTNVTGGMYVGTVAGTRFAVTDLGAGTMEINKWQFFVYTNDGSAGNFYKNGILKAGPKEQPYYDAWNGIKIGIATTNTIHGSFDDLKVYNRALSAQEVRQLYMTPFCMFEREAIELFSAMTPAAEALEVYVWDTTAA